MRKPTTICDFLKRNIQNILEANTSVFYFRSQSLVLQTSNGDILIFENPQIKFHK